MKDQWAEPPPNFTYLYFERVDPALNESRYYYLAWQPTLLGPAVVRMWGRRGGQQQVRATPFDTLPDAWPEIRRHIRARLRHDYRIVAPAQYTGESKNST
jgi:predicted DNA-binding WGR domain protein